MSSSRAKSARPRAAEAEAARPPAGGPQRPTTRLALIAAGVVLAVTVAGYFLTRADRPGDALDGGQKVAHVHGLGVDPADGTLYAGTHYGLFQVPEQGSPTRVAGRVQDFMGFTVAGPNHYLASGHPGDGGPTSTPSRRGTASCTAWTR